MIEETVYDFFKPFTLYRCLQCGCQVDWLTYQNRQVSRARGVEMPKFLSEESKRAWVAKVKASKAARKRKAENEPISIDEPFEAFASLPDDRQALDVATSQEDEGPGWRLKTILALQDQRESYARQLADIEVAIKTVKALA
jgi:hypothetical protein